MRPTDQMILTCLDSLEGSDLPSGNKIAEVYKGYAASFGPVVIRSGVLQACIHYHTTTPGRKKLIALMFAIYLHEKQEQTSEDIKMYLTSKWPVWDTSQRKQFRSMMMQIAVSMKMALRTFHFEKSLNENLDEKDD